MSDRPPPPEARGVRSRSDTIAILDRHGLFLKKSLGQNFLVDPEVLDRIVAAIDPSRDDAILEIGAGIGTLTRALADRARAVAALEIDPRFLPALEETLAGSPPVRIVRGDVLRVDLRALLAELGDGPRKAAANLPYYITTPALSRLLECHDLLDRIVVLVQKEVAERMVARAGTRAYGAFSVFVQYWSEPAIASEVPASAFLPAPSVSSAIVRLEIRPRPPVDVPDERLFFRVVRAAFGQRRKTLANALAGAGFGERPALESVLAAAGIDPRARGETLGLAQFAELARGLAAKQHLSPLRGPHATSNGLPRDPVT